MWSRKLLGLLTLIALLAVACGGEAQQTAQDLAPTLQAAVEEVAPTVAAAATQAASPTDAPAETEQTEAPSAETASGVIPLPDPIAVSGDIVTAGSSTVYPLSERMAERYQNEGYAGQITIDSIGSGGGYERFCETGETDIANASRAIRESEIENCRAIGREPIEFRVGTDAIAFVVNPANDFVTDLTLEQLALAFGTAETWADVDPSFPAEPIQRYSPGTDSGTFDFMVEEVFDEDSTAILSAANIQFSEDDNVLVQGVEGDPYAIGYFGYAYYLENSDRLNIINLEGVEPTAQSAEDGSYPMARPLFLYSDANIMQEKAQVADFINFYLTYVNEEIVDVGYFPASDAALQAAHVKWLIGMGASVFPEPDPIAVSGDIVTAGSSTVYPLSERMAERYQNEGYAGQITIDSIGSGGGYERFCETGETDIANASRAIRESEIENCRAIGREPIEFRVGTDAIAFVVNPANDFVTNLTLEQLALAFGTAETWADVDPSFPAEPIQRYSPGTDSGTFDFMVEEVFDEDSTAILSAANIQFSEDDNVLVQGVEGDPYAIGYFGYAYYLENSDRLNIINLEGVEPTAQSAEDGSYPMARPLFLYSDANIMQEKAQVADFINFYLTYVNEEIVDVGYFPASDAALQAAYIKWLIGAGLVQFQR